MALKLLTIVGGGLAGLALGVALRRRDIPVTLHEATRYPRHRVCGEFISGISGDSLDALGISDLFASSITHSTSAWYLHDRLIAEHTLPIPAIGISRHQLDHALQQRFTTLGGDLICNSRLPCSPREALVWCAGRRPVRSPWVGLKCHLRHCELSADLEMHLGRGAYVGLARVENGVVNVCGLFPAIKERADGNFLLASLRDAGLASLAERIEPCGIIPESLSAVAGFRLGWQPIPVDLFALGDSLAMIPPFTGNGMSMAFESAHAALTPLDEFAKGQIDWTSTLQNTRQDLTRRFSRRLTAAHAMHPFLTSAAGQALFAAFSRRGVLPFRSIFQLLR